MERQSIELYSNTNQVMNDAIDRIVIEIYNKRKDMQKAQKILLTGCGPQCGSTSTSIGLGISLAAAKWNTLIVDCDLRKSINYKKLNQETNIGLADYLLNDTYKDELNYDNITYLTNFDHLSYIPSGRLSMNPARLFCSSIMKNFIEYVDNHYDYVIFDFPSISVTPDAQTMFKDMDGIILISALQHVTKKQIKDAKHKVEPFADKYYGMIINKIDMGLYKKYVKSFDYYFLDKDGNQKLVTKKVKKYLKIHDKKQNYEYNQNLEYNKNHEYNKIHEYNKNYEYNQNHDLKNQECCNVVGEVK